LLPEKRPQLLLFLCAHCADHSFNQYDERSEAMQLLGMIRLVLWSFFGVRNSKAHATDLAKVNFTLLPFVAIVLAALVGATVYGVVLLVANPTSTMQGF
jgi:hypothetical protein